MRRRLFLKQTFAGSAAAMVFPAWASAEENKSFPDLCRHLAEKSPAEEAYWEMVKKQFPVSGHTMMVNAANLCPSPHFVNEQVNASFAGLEKDLSFQYRAAFSEERSLALQKLADFLHVSESEVGITRNTSESNNIIVHGLDLKKGDEVVLWEQNHPTNGIAWEEQAKRFGFKVKWVALPTTPASIAELIQPFADAITSKTRLLSFSHISNVSGLALPAKELCMLAKEKGILSMVDGAQSFGVIDIDLQSIGCDFYTGSMHKWLMGPLENGVVYMRGDVKDQVWPSVVGAGWKPDSTSVDAKFCVLGQRNDTTASAISNILDFHMAIGKKQINERSTQINTYLKQQLKAGIPQVQFVTPVDEALSAGVTIIRIPDTDSAAIYNKLYSDYQIACAPTGGLRFSPHIYNTLADMDRIVEVLTEVV